MQFAINALTEGSHFALIALGFLLIYRTTKFFDFAYGTLLVVGPYLAYTIYFGLGWPFLIAVVLSIVLCGGFGVSMELGIYRSMRKFGATPFVLLVASLGLFVIIQNSLSIIYGDEVKTLRTGDIETGLPFLGGRISTIQVWTVAVASALFIIVTLLLRKTKLGKAHKAVANDAELAVISGINSELVITWTFFLGSCLAGVAGILIALDIDMTPTMGFPLLLRGIVAMIIGGVGSVPGAALGGVLLGLTRSLGVVGVDTAWQDAIAFGLLLLFLLVRPQGFLGKAPRRVSV